MASKFSWITRSRFFYISRGRLPGHDVSRGGQIIPTISIKSRNLLHFSRNPLPLYISRGTKPYHPHVSRGTKPYHSTSLEEKNHTTSTSLEELNHTTLHLSRKKTIPPPRLSRNLTIPLYISRGTKSYHPYVSRGNKPYQSDTHLKKQSIDKCNQCDFVYSQTCDLKKHLKRHSGEKPRFFSKKGLGAMRTTLCAPTC